MKTRIRELAKPGIYGSEDNPQVVTAADLKQIAETFVDVKRAPIQFGHWGSAADPRLGNLIAVTWDEEAQTLWGTFEEQDALAQAVDDGFYPDCSIYSKRRASDGKMYIVHVAYLGQEAPAIKDLLTHIAQSITSPTAEQIAASETDGGFLIPAVRTRLLALSDFFVAVPAVTAPQHHPKEGKKTMTLDEALAALEAEKAKTLTLSEQVAQVNTSLEKQKEKLDALSLRYPEEELLLSENVDPRVSGMYAQLRKGKVDGLVSAAAGKVPKAKMPLVRTLADTLSASQSIELSEGDKKEKLDGFTLLGRIFEAIPSPVNPGVLNLSEGDQKPTAPINAREMLKSF